MFRFYPDEEASYQIDVKVSSTKKTSEVYVKFIQLFITCSFKVISQMMDVTELV